MKRLTLFVLLTIVVSATTCWAEHYLNGAEGLLCGSAPQPGFYYRMYNMWYGSDKLMDSNGEEIPLDFKTKAFVNAHRLIWVGNTQLIGANPVLYGIIPIVETDIEMKPLGIDEHGFGLGDVTAAGFLNWDWSQFEVVAGMGMMIPTGTDDSLADPGKGMWSFMPSIGATVYFDEAKKFHASILSWYEVHSENGKDTRPGDDFHFEWGIGTTLLEGGLNLGIVGYSQWQITDDSGSNVIYDASVHDEVHAVGGEASLFWPKINTMFQFRYLSEFGAVDRPEGQSFFVNLTYVF